MTTYLIEHVSEVLRCGKEPSVALAKEMTSCLEPEIRGAYEDRDRECELSLNRCLFLLYKLYWFKTSYFGDILEMSPVLFQIRTTIERALKADCDEQVLPDILDAIPAESSRFPDYLNQVVHTHGADRHDLYEDFIPNQCDVEQLKHYFFQETTVDVNVDDFLALTQIGCERSCKTEIGSNYWDEIGRGKIESMHSVLFEKLFTTLDLEPNVPIEDISLEALVCGNLQILVSLYRRFFPYAAGFFYVCEYMTPKRFRTAMEAWERLGLPEEGTAYHRLHISLDQVHADHWMENVIVPFNAVHPELNRQVISGAMYRLNASLRYLDKLQVSFDEMRSDSLYSQ